jgi:hypothetical protein
MSDIRSRKHSEKNYRARIVFNELVKTTKGRQFFGAMPVVSICCARSEMSRANYANTPAQVRTAHYERPGQNSPKLGVGISIQL